MEEGEKGVVLKIGTVSEEIWWSNSFYLISQLVQVFSQILFRWIFTITCEMDRTDAHQYSLIFSIIGW